MVGPPANRSRHPRPSAADFDGVPIEKVDVFQAVLQRIQDWIETAELKPGDRLPPERELALKLGVSRTSIRQGLKVLTSINRLEQRHGSGTYLKSRVRDPVVSILLGEQTASDARLLQEVSDIRAVIDAFAVEAAGERADPTELRRLADFLEQRRSELNDEPAAPGSLDLRFEAAIAEMTGNGLLRRIQSIVHDLYLHTWADLGRAPADVMSLHREHLLILERMTAGDWETAKSLMFDHVSRRAPIQLQERDVDSA